MGFRSFTRGAADELGHGLFGRTGGSAGAQFGEGSTKQQAAGMEKSDAVRECFNFRERVRSEKKRCAVAIDQVIAHESAKIRGGQGIETPRRLVQQENGRCVQYRTSETQPLHGAGRKCTHLAIERVSNADTPGGFGDAAAGFFGREIAQSGKKLQVLAPRETRVKSNFRPTVKSHCVTHMNRLADYVVAGNFRATSSG